MYRRWKLGRDSQAFDYGEDSTASAVHPFSGSDFGIDVGPRTPTKLDCKHSVAKREFPMNEEALNLSIRKFLKAVGVGSQRAIEHAVADAAAGGRIAGAESFPAKMTLEIVGLNLNVVFTGDISLQ